MTNRKTVVYTTVRLINVDKCHEVLTHFNQMKTRMWADALAPSVQRRKVWMTPTTIVPCSSAAKTRNPLKFVGGAPNLPTDLSR